jgi:hypothetical protein
LNRQLLHQRLPLQNWEQFRKPVNSLNPISGRQLILNRQLITLLPIGFTPGKWYQDLMLIRLEQFPDQQQSRNAIPK